VLADLITHIKAGQISHCEGAHGKTKIINHLVDLLGQGTFFQQKFRLTFVGIQHAIANKTITNANHDTDFVDGFGKLHHCRHHVW